ncbi:MAG: DUF1538 domain-containing protein [Oscillospiraceae bacterium]|nr:DUF1538 domain-containing protein [Oscillospiraceae bacterium]
MYQNKLREKLDEALSAVLPIITIVLLLSLTIAPMTSSVLLAFLLGGVLLVAGMMFFTLGAELAMEPMGEQVGSRITKTRKLWIILPTGFLLGALITVSEPDLQVLAGQVQSIPNNALIFSVAGGVGLFLTLALLRILLGVRLRTLLLAFYAAVLALALLAPADFLAVAFDAGGVTTGPMTVPFILAFGVGISAIRSDGKAQGDSFGLIALCSVGPVLAVLVLSLVFRADGAGYTAAVVPDFTDSVELRALFTSALPTYLREIATALLPIMAFFALFQVTGLHLGKKTLLRIGVGLGYTYVGLVLFLTGVSVGFMPAGTFLGRTLAGVPYRWIVIPVGMLIGYYIVKAEPAVYVLMKQVEELTSGAITGAALQRSLSLGVAVSVGLAMIRVLTGVSILYFIIPGYALSLALSFFVPDLFTAIAFDSGGVASGPMTATFLLPLATGACLAVGGNVVTDAFGVVAMVAMTPLVAIQLLGVVYRLRASRGTAAAADTADVDARIDWLDDYEIIAL